MADKSGDPEMTGTPELLNAAPEAAPPADYTPKRSFGSLFGDPTTEMSTPPADATTPMPSEPTPSNPAPVTPTAAPITPTAAPTEAPASSSGVPGLPLSAASTAPEAPQMPPSVPNTGWSPLGATPGSPPVRSAPEPGAAQFLPPVLPPKTEAGPTGPPTVAPVIQAPAETKSGSRWGWRALVSFVAGGLIAASGFGAAQLTAIEDNSTQEVSVGSNETQVSQEQTTTTTPSVAPDSGSVPLVPLDVDEPATFVADALGPAVVQIETDFGLGSGVIYDDGLILTNNHVVEGAQIVRVKLADGQVLSGEIVGTDPTTDIAVIAAGAGTGLPSAQLATGEKATVGQIAIAIGSPFDLQQSVTAGIVSAVDRPIPNLEGVVAMIQTDAPINPGNSGGALADRQGRVIGINTSIQTDGTSQANVGVGFAIPIDTALRIADLLVAGEPIQRGFLGVRGVSPKAARPGSS